MTYSYLGFIFSFILINLSSAVFAELRLPSIISDNLVLQQDTKVNIWGWGIAGSTVIVKNSWSKVENKTIVYSNGKWKLNIQTPKASKVAQTIMISSGDEQVLVKNVLVGEVWLASGQSNMDFPMAKSSGWRTGVLNADKDIQRAQYPSIRIFHVQQNLSPFYEKEDCVGQWKEVNPNSITNFSAVAYYFGEELFKNLDQPIGLIQSTWGGTRVEAWTPNAYMNNNALYKGLFEEQQQSQDKYIQDSLAFRIAQHKYEQEKTTNTSLAAPKKPKHPNNNNVLSTLWNGMINPLVPFSIKGVIWYQGESNSNRSEDYTAVFSNMIFAWRKEWNLGNFPFYFVQIAPHYKQSPMIREAQLNTLSQVKNSGMVVITDVGDSTDIHPRNKKVPAIRLAKWALVEQYGKNIEKSGPIFKKANFQKEKATVEFDYTSEGLYCPDLEIRGFEIAGEDGKFHRAIAKIVNNSIEAYAPEVKEPLYIRYGWDNFFRVNLYNKAGLPASPFRSSIRY